MSKELEAGAAGSLPLASLSLLVSPLQLTYSYIWQVILQRNVRLYSRVEEFVTVVTESVPELLSFRQTAQLILGLRAKVILELLREEGKPDSQTIQTLINKLKVSASPGRNDTEVEESETNFMVLVQTLLRSPAERKRFFKDVYPVQYGSKFNTGLQALIAGLVCKLEKLLPVPNLTQIGTMITAESSVLEACGHLIPNQDALKILLRQQTPKGLLINSAVSANVGDCVLSSLSYRFSPPAPPNPPPQSPKHSTPEVPPNPNPPPQSPKHSTPEVLPNPNPPPQSPKHSTPEVPPNPNPPPESPELLEVALNPSSPVSLSDPDDVGAMSDNWDDTPSDRREGDGDTRGDDVEENTKQKAATVKVGSSTAATPGVSMKQQIVEVETGAPPKPGLRSMKEKLQHPLKSVPIKVVPVPIKPTSISQQNTTGSESADGQQKPQTRRVTLHQWVSQIASNLPLPALPPILVDDLSAGDDAKQSAKKKKTTPVKKTPVKPPPNKFTCEVCDKSYPYQSQLRDHQRIHSGEKPFTCTACDKSFRTRGFLSNHLKTHNSLRHYNCGHCGQWYQHKWGLHRHILAHTGQKRFHCHICNKDFTQSGYFKRHMEVHTSKESHPCQHCGKSFPTLFKLTNHERWHTRERPHMCERCGRRFFAPSLLKRHMGYHTGERQYLCSLCGRTFVYLYDLKKHQRNHDKKKNKLPCPMCQNTFSSKHCLKIHLRIHTNEKPYKCQECGKSFTQVGNLAVHRRKHSSERPYSCEECGNTYKLVSHLKAHCLTHTAERPWTCATCGKGFTYQGGLRKHERIHTRETSGYPRKPRYKSKQKKPSLKRKHDDDEDEDEY